MTFHFGHFALGVVAGVILCKVYERYMASKAAA